MPSIIRFIKSNGVEFLNMEQERMLLNTTTSRALSVLIVRKMEMEHFSDGELEFSVDSGTIGLVPIKLCCNAA